MPAPRHTTIVEQPGLTDDGWFHALYYIGNTLLPQRFRGEVRGGQPRTVVHIGRRHGIIDEIATIAQEPAVTTTTQEPTPEP